MHKADLDGIQFSDNDYLEPSVCHMGSPPKSGVQELVPQNLNNKESAMENFTDINILMDKSVPWVTEKNIQLEILVPINSTASGERYFVPNGDRGLRWLQFYFQGCDTTGILQRNEIKECKVLQAHVNNFKVLFPGKTIYRDSRMETKDLQPLDMDLTNLFAANRNVLESVYSTLTKVSGASRPTKNYKNNRKDHTTKKTQNKLMMHSRKEQYVQDVEKNTCLSNLKSLQQDWLVHLVLGNLPRRGGLGGIVHTVDINDSEKEENIVLSAISSIWTVVKQNFTRRSRKIGCMKIDDSGSAQLDTYC